MDERVAKLKTPAECERFAKNARERDRPDLADEARKRAVALRAEAYGATSDAERECLEAIYAYEEVLTARNGRKTKASRTWQMIKRHGILGAVERAVNRPEEAVGYTALLEMGLQEYAFEAVVVRYPDLFSSEAVQRSRARLDEWNRA
ncbi:MAG: hypothetical protein ACYDDA_12095 [Acidiferrobacteraceae bacterium]